MTSKLRSGKALAASSTSPIRKYRTGAVANGLEPETENSITTRDALLEELDEIDERGYAYNHEEQLDGVKAMGVPVCRSNGQVLGAFSVASPANRMKGEWFENELPETILATANEFELQVSLT
jgi:DNA-binding IclR family transcriptional regulator